MDLGKSMSRVWQTFSFHPLTFRHRVNNFIAQQIYSPGGSKPTHEDENRMFAAVFHCDFNLTRVKPEFKESWIWESPCPGVWQTFPFHPLTFRHRVNNFIVKLIYSSHGPKPTGEVGNRMFAAVFHCDLNFTGSNHTLKNHGLGKVHVPRLGGTLTFQSQSFSISILICKKTWTWETR